MFVLHKPKYSLLWIASIRSTWNMEVIVVCKQYIRYNDTSQAVKYNEKPERDTAL